MPVEIKPVNVTSTARDLEEYWERFGIRFLAKSDMDNKKLMAHFPYFVVKGAYTLINNLIYSESMTDISNNTLKEMVLQHLKPIDFLAAGGARFNRLTRSHSQSVRDLVLQLQTQEAECDYCAQLKDQLPDGLVAGIQLPEVLQKLLLYPDRKFQSIRKICEHHEDVKQVTKSDEAVLLNHFKRNNSRMHSNLEQTFVLQIHRFVASQIVTLIQRFKILRNEPVSLSFSLRTPRYYFRFYYACIRNGLFNPFRKSTPTRHTHASAYGFFAVNHLLNEADSSSSETYNLLSLISILSNSSIPDNLVQYLETSSTLIGRYPIRLVCDAYLKGPPTETKLPVILHRLWSTPRDVLGQPEFPLPTEFNIPSPIILNTMSDTRLSRNRRFLAQLVSKTTNIGSTQHQHDFCKSRRPLIQFADT
ncbi:hypothetical protein CLF_110008 [Clonorchis sinensis]|uniref:Uncharacterized protein n=1 Tax=Clonorchis sinensis TaxID=79923 RepID=H2KUR7_CLOSI|nr:hypothetical protein CLF_110008 [Clonorchis sinensis]